MKLLEKGKTYTLTNEPCGFENGEPMGDPCKVKIVDVSEDQAIGWIYSPNGKLLLSWTGSLEGQCYDHHLGSQDIYWSKE